MATPSTDAVVPVVDTALIQKYDTPGPRYTSYPTAPQFTDQFVASDLVDEIRQSNASSAPLSLYFHLPFCESVCFFCGCNVTFTADRSRPAPYTSQLIREMDLILAHLDRRRPVEQLHWGGGTPTFFSAEQLETLWNAIAERFSFAPGAEIGVEIDPRETRPAHLETLARCGFNRLSMGVQDFDPRVQAAVNRVQPFELTRDTIVSARGLGFESISVDLIYGLPLQNEASFEGTIERVIELNPDRIALFNFAFLPDLIRHQKAIKAAELPAAPVKLAILRRAIERLTQAGYRFIGMDHFAKPDDPLCRAQDDGSLGRNFQGYTTRAQCDLVAMGVSAISSIGRVYSQNQKAIAEFSARIEAGELPVMRGLRLSDDDLIRRRVILRLMCDFVLDFELMSRELGLDFESYFAEELRALQPLADDELLVLHANRLSVTARGRLLIRNIAMRFDRYLTGSGKFSRTV